MFTLLRRVNPEKNEARFYLVQTGPGLLDEHVVTRFWGRIGGSQRHLITPCETADEAEALAEKLVRAKVKRGYEITELEFRERNNGSERP